MVDNHHPRAVEMDQGDNPEPKECPECLRNVREGMSRCPHCGNELGTPSDRYDQSNATIQDFNADVDAGENSSAHFFLVSVEAASGFTAIAKARAASKLYVKHSDEFRQTNVSLPTESNKAETIADLYGWSRVDEPHHTDEMDGDELTDLLDTASRRGAFRETKGRVVCLGEDGTPIADREAIEAELERENMWLIAAVAKRIQSSESADQTSGRTASLAEFSSKQERADVDTAPVGDSNPTPGETDRRHCPECGEKTLHKPTKERYDDEHDAEVPHYQCGRCGSENSFIV